MHTKRGIGARHAHIYTHTKLMHTGGHKAHMASIHPSLHTHMHTHMRASIHSYTNAERRAYTNAYTTTHTRIHNYRQARAYKCATYEWFR